MNAVTIVMRLIHIVLGALWVGGVGLLVMFIMPAVARTGPVGGQFMQHMVRNTKVTVYLPILGMFNVLSGLVLIWRDSSASGGTFMKTASGMTYSVGALAAIIALIFGSVMSGRSAAQLKAMMAAAETSGGLSAAEQGQRIAMLQGRMRLGARVAFALLLITVVCMAVARYV